MVVQGLQGCTEEAEESMAGVCEEQKCRMSFRLQIDKKLCGPEN